VDHSWKTSLSERFAETFDRFERGLGDCPDSMWEESLWDVTEAWPAGAVLGAGRPEAERRQVFSAFWFIAWHSLDCTHYDLEGLPFPTWAPPSPFSAAADDSQIDADYYLPRRVFTRSELQEYAADTRRKADETVASLADERVARPIPAGHRYAGIPYASLLLMCLTHSREHLAQLEMFLGQRGVART
jgi:DinB family protein